MFYIIKSFLYNFQKVLHISRDNMYYDEIKLDNVPDNIIQPKTVLNNRAFLKNVFANLSGTVDLSIRLLSNAGGGGNRFTKALLSWQYFVYYRAVYSSSLQCNAPQYWHIRLHGPHE